MEKADIEEVGSIIPRVLGGRDVDIALFAVLVAYPVPYPVAEEELDLLQSRVHQVTAEELERLGVLGHQF